MGQMIMIDSDVYHRLLVKEAYFNGYYQELKQFDIPVPLETGSDYQYQGMKITKMIHYWKYGHLPWYEKLKENLKNKFI